MREGGGKLWISLKRWPGCQGCKKQFCWLGYFFDLLIYSLTTCFYTDITKIIQYVSEILQKDSGEGTMKKMKSIRYGNALVCSCLAILFLFSVAQAADVTNSIHVSSSRSFYNSRTGEFSFNATLENISSDNFSPPIIAVISNLSSDQVTVANPDGTDSSGNPYFDYSGLLGDDNILNAGEPSGAKEWIFHNPMNVRFTYDAQIIAGAGPADDVPPSISITNPVNNSVTTTSAPYITIEFSDDGSGINLGSLAVQINGTDSTSFFGVTNTRATYQATSPFPSGSNVIYASISDNAGNTSTVVSDFTIGSSAEPIRYIFSVANNDWIFASPGDETCAEYLSRENLGLSDLSDVVSLSRARPGDNLFFSLSGQDGILQSPCYGSNSLYFTNTQLGIGNNDQICAEHTGLDGSASFSVEGEPDIYQSLGANANWFLRGNSQLGIGDDVQVGCLHIGYDGKSYFCRSDESGIFQSTGDGTNTTFLTASNLGVPDSTIDAFAILPETIPPEITITNPMDGAFLNTTTPNITVTFQDTGSGIDTATFYAEINGANMTSAFAVTDTGATYQVPITSPLPVGDNSMLVRIRDRIGNEAGATSNFRVGILRAIPGATPTSGTTPLTVHFTTDGEDPAGTIEIFRWDFDGDSTWDTYDTVANDYTHIYNNPGTYTALLYVQSSTGETATESITITVENNPPVATADVVPSNGEVPLAVALYGSGSDSDGSIVLYEWDFEGDGIYEWSSSTTGNTTYTYNEIGTYQAIFRVTDDAGLMGTAMAYTTVIEANPTGSPTATAAASPTEGQAPLTVSFNGTATDPNNDVVLYEWDFDGDGTFDWSSASSGSTTHIYTEAGLHVARFRATDSTDLTGSDQVGITVNLQVSLSVTNDTVGILRDMVNLTEMGGVAITASSTYEQCSTYYPVSYLRDGNEGTCWMSTQGDTPNQGSDTFVETVFNNPRTVVQINITGGSYYQYYGITRARIELFDDSDNTLYSGEHDLPQDAQVQVGFVENVNKFRLTALAANDGGGTYSQVSIAEIEVLDDTGFTATASSTYSNYVVDNLFDGDTYNTIWVSNENDHPIQGTNPWVEVSFSSPQTVSRMIIDQSSTYYSNYGTTRCRIELIDGAGNNLYTDEVNLPTDSETIDIPETNNVDLFRFTILEAIDSGFYVCVISELDILEEQNGQYISLVQKSNQGNYTASSEWKTNCYSNYPVSNLIDGNTESYWMSAQNDTPNYGVYPSVEITLPSPQTVSQIVISGGSWYQYYGITKAKIELFDDNEIVLYSQEHDLQATTEINLPNIENVLKARFTALESPDPYNYNYCTWGEITLYKKYDEPQITTTDIGTTLSADTTVSIYIVDSDGNIVRSLVNNEPRQQGNYSDNWDLNDNNGFRMADGVYYAVLEYVDANGQVTTYDLTHSTGGTRYSFPTGSGCDRRDSMAKSNFSPYEDDFSPITFRLCKASEVTVFIGPLLSGSSTTRIRTIINRKALPAGSHRVYWDGLDDQGNIAHPPPGDRLILGMWRYTLPNNAIYMTGGRPVISDVSSDPNYFNPLSNTCLEDGDSIRTTYTLSEDVNTVELRVIRLSTKNTVRVVPKYNVVAGENYIYWDGRNNNGDFVDAGDYQLILIATDAEGNNSMLTSVNLIRLTY